MLFTKFFPNLGNYLLSLGVAGLSVTAGLVINASPTFAHAVETNFALDLLTRELELTSVYSTGEALEFADVKVFAPNQPHQPWMTAKTDQKGRFSFQPDRRLEGEWTVLITQDGHADILKVPVNSQGVKFDHISFGGNLDIHLPMGEFAIAPWFAQAQETSLPIHLGVESNDHQMVAFLTINRFSLGLRFSWIST